ncbi:cation:proton antiporter [Clavibacter zhangzhiyongii]|uniref:cation:proton antiporter n=1 Tax=Clavibacter zhangzhiyongii TaxID=2768071 RepID=UPI00195EE089|nr:cation:proton antiporter [Clavibacter zhangzhiyongii]MBM7026739.1 cation:proton antiporter [Clavibacter zhangzhiyongii]
MHHGPDLIVLGLLFVLAYAFGQLGKRVGLPAIPIYMLVGLLASPNVDWFPLDFASGDIELIAVFGLILLLFNLGLEFDQDEFFGNAGKLIVSGGSYVLINMGVGFAFGFALGWGTREALIIAGMTATSSSAIVTKLLIELNRLANDETPMILGVTVVEDIFIAVYLAIVSVVLSGQTEPWAVVGQLAVSFAFLVVMFTVARKGGAFLSRFLRTRDVELFTVLFFGLAILFGGIGEVLGVTDAIGAFLIGLVLGATRVRNRIEQIAIPLRDVFGAFFFLNFGLALDPREFPTVVIPVLVAVVMTVTLNLIAGQFVAWLNGHGAQAGINTAFILQNRGEFALILATLSLSAGLDERIQPFAGLYVLVMAIMGPLLAANSVRIGTAVLPTRYRSATKRAAEKAARDAERAGALALFEAAERGDQAIVDGHDDGLQVTGSRPGTAARGTTPGTGPEAEGARGGARVDDGGAVDGDDAHPAPDRRRAEQAGQQSDHDTWTPPTREREPDY